MNPLFDIKYQFHKKGGHDVNFEPHNEDTATNVRYYGFVSSYGSWIIMKEDASTSTAVTYRYSGGRSGYAVAWTGRADLTYDLISEIGDSL